MAQYELWSFDVWGNEKDGYEVNDRSNWTYNFQMDSESTDAQIVKALVDWGFLADHVKPSDIEIEGDGEHFFFNDAATHYPLGELILVDGN